MLKEGDVILSIEQDLFESELYDFIVDEEVGSEDDDSFRDVAISSLLLLSGTPTEFAFKIVASGCINDDSSWREGIFCSFSLKSINSFGL